MTPSEREEFEQMKQEIGRLREAIRFLAFAKKTDDTYAFFDWLVKHDVFDDQRTRLDVVLAILGARVNHETPPVTREVKGVTSALLYQAGPPSYEDAVLLLGQALGVSRHPIEALIDAFAQQGLHHWLVALRPAQT